MPPESNSPSRIRTYNKPVNSRNVKGRKPLPANTSGKPTGQLAPQLAPAPADADLARLLDAWPRLPLPLRKAILALLDAAGP